MMHSSPQSLLSLEPRRGYETGGPRYGDTFNAPDFERGTIRTYHKPLTMHETSICGGGRVAYWML
jgi:hypothetical protein